MSTFYANLKKKLHFFIFFVVRQLSFKWYFKLRIELGFKTYHPGLSRFEKKKNNPFSTDAIDAYADDTDTDEILG